MALTPHSDSRKVTGISPTQQQRITDFLQGAVYCWCKNRPNEWFSMRDLMGGVNNDWQGTPLQDLYSKHVANHSSDPFRDTGHDAGWLLKSLMIKDERSFETREQELNRQYRWVPDEEDT